MLELSHIVEHGMVTYPGLPAPVIGSYLSFEESRSQYDAGTEFSIGSLTMVGNTGPTSTPRRTGLPTVTTWPG